jgi:hypothetical protein
MGDIPSLERFQAIPNGKSRLKVTITLGPSQIVSAADKAALDAAGKARD